RSCRGGCMSSSSNSHRWVMPLLAEKTTEKTPYQLPWDGTLLHPGKYIAFDTETVAIPEDRFRKEIPELVLATASDGVRNVVLRPEQLNDFVRLHSDRHFVVFNAAFDFWVVLRHLRCNFA